MPFTGGFGWIPLDRPVFPSTPRAKPVDQTGTWTDYGRYLLQGAEELERGRDPAGNPLPLRPPAVGTTVPTPAVATGAVADPNKVAATSTKDTTDNATLPAALPTGSMTYGEKSGTIALTPESKLPPFLPPVPNVSDTVYGRLLAEMPRLDPNQKGQVLQRTKSAIGPWSSEKLESLSGLENATARRSYLEGRQEDQRSKELGEQLRLQQMERGRINPLAGEMLGQQKGLAEVDLARGQAELARAQGGLARATAAKLGRSPLQEGRYESNWALYQLADEQLNNDPMLAKALLEQALIERIKKGDIPKANSTLDKVSESWRKILQEDVRQMMVDKLNQPLGLRLAQSGMYPMGGLGQ